MPSAHLQGRVKSALSAWSKATTAHIDRTQAGDCLGLRVVVPKTLDCYRVLERVCRAFETLPDANDDYIANPKSNGYRSIHAGIVIPGGQTVELQIRTLGMHVVAESGTASHLQYKQAMRMRTRARLVRAAIS